MNDLKVFKSTEFGELGVMMIAGKEYFPATQCAKILGYSNPRKAILDHCKAEGVTIRDGVSYTTNQYGVTTQQATQIKYIDEGNLYRLIVSSKLPAAEKFERWVFDEVLPSIRQTGGYGSVDIEKIISRTAAAAVSEAMKQIVPLLMNGARSEQDMVWEETPAKSKPRKPCGIICKLSPEIRNTVDEMLCANMTYADVQKYLHKNGIGISQAAICRYYKSFIS